MSRRYRIKSIFGPTLQGEGTYAGTVVKFLRFSGCNKWSGRAEDKPSAVCRFCDTDFVGATRMTADEIVAELERLGGPRRVVISGGEPTLQLDVGLMSTLTGAGYRCHLETNGSLPLGEALDFFEHITMSPKQAFAETKLEICDDLKILHPPIGDGITPEGFEDFPYRRLFLQAVWDDQYEANLRSTISRVVELDARLSVQTHKIVGVE
jgi:7-carboxy-7-deazaguanine synthase